MTNNELPQFSEYVPEPGIEYLETFIDLIVSEIGEEIGALLGGEDLAKQRIQEAIFSVTMPNNKFSKSELKLSLSFCVDQRTPELFIGDKEQDVLCDILESIGVLEQDGDIYSVSEEVCEKLKKIEGLYMEKESSKEGDFDDIDPELRAFLKEDGMLADWD